MRITQEQWKLIRAPMSGCPHCAGEARMIPKRPMDVQGLIFHAAYVKCRQCHAKGTFFFLEDFDTPEEAWDAARAAWERSDGCSARI